MTREWYKKFLLARNYFTQNGNSKIDKFYCVDSVNLGFWMETQKAYYKKGKLEQEQIDLLNSIDMVWSAKPDFEELWMERFEQAKEYSKKYGNLNIKKRGKTKEEIFIIGWIATQKNMKKSGNLSEKKIQLLESIGIVWDEKIDYDAIWNDYFLKAQEYYLKHKILYIPTNCTEEENILRKWLQRQRNSYRYRSFRPEDIPFGQVALSDERVSKLESIGMIWNVKDFVDNRQLSEKNRKKIEKLFLNYLGYYITVHKNEIESYEDVLRINEEFFTYLEKHQKSKSR